MKQEANAEAQKWMMKTINKKLEKKRYTMRDGNYVVFLTTRKIFQILKNARDFDNPMYQSMLKLDDLDDGTGVEFVIEKKIENKSQKTSPEAKKKAKYKYENRN